CARSAIPGPARSSVNSTAAMESAIRYAHWPRSRQRSRAAAIPTGRASPCSDAIIAVSRKTEEEGEYAYWNLCLFGVCNIHDQSGGCCTSERRGHRDHEWISGHADHRCLQDRVVGAAANRRERLRHRGGRQRQGSVAGPTAPLLEGVHHHDVATAEQLLPDLV